MQDTAAQTSQADAPTVAVTPAIDTRELAAAFACLHKEYGGADASRAAIVDLLRDVYARSRAEAETVLATTANGIECAGYLSDSMDQIIGAIYDHAAKHIYHRTAEPQTDRMAIIATGGYGRALLAPGSDIDLLFLLPYKKSPWGESIAEHILYLLWDVGLKVGHATRTIDHCLKFAAGDDTIRSSLLDARLLHGAPELFEEFQTRFWTDVSRNSARAFVEAKMKERDDRHTRSGSSRYRVEPNIKDGKGGLRDLHTLHWLSLYLKQTAPDDAGVKKGVLSEAELATFKRCETFLWTVRCHLHFLTGRAEERQIGRAHV